MNDRTERRLGVLKAHLNNTNDINDRNHIKHNGTFSTSLASFAFKTWAQNPKPQHISEVSKSILVTGAAGGLGSDMCKTLLKKGCNVFACDLKMSSLVEVFSENTSDPNLHLFEMDVTKQDSVEQAVEKVKEILEGRKLFAVVNNAGVGSVPGSPIMKALVEHNEQECKVMFDINVLGTIRVTNAFYPLITKSLVDKDASGAIVNIASVAGLLGIPYGSYYSASKFAVVGYSDSLRRELKSVGIRVGCIEPGFAKTAILHGPEFDKNSEFAKQGTRRHRIMKAWTDDAQDPSNVTNAVLDVLFTTPCPEHQLVDQQKYKSVNKLLIEYFPYYMSDKMMA